MTRKPVKETTRDGLRVIPLFPAEQQQVLRCTFAVDAAAHRRFTQVRLAHASGRP